MDPVKVIIFVAAFLLLLLLGRKLSAGGESGDTGSSASRATFTQKLSPVIVTTKPRKTQKNYRRSSAPTFHFRSQYLPIKRNPDGQIQSSGVRKLPFSRPLIWSPDLQIPTCFYDHLFLETRDPEDGGPWT